MTKAKKPERRKKIRGSWASYIVDGRGVCNTIELAKLLVAWGNIPERLSDAKAMEISLLAKAYLLLNKAPRRKGKK